MQTPDIIRLKTSWTKYDAVKVIDIVGDRNISNYLSEDADIDHPILRSFLGVKSLSEPLPYYWLEIEKYPKQLKLFALIAAISTHYSNIKKFAGFSKRGEMAGVYEVEAGKIGTNIRSALVVSGASLDNYRKENKVPYNLSALFENGKVGLLIKDLFKERLARVGYDTEHLSNNSHFLDTCYENGFVQALGLNKDQFNRWINGEDLNLNKELFHFDQLSIYKEIPLLRVHQWLNNWDDIDFKTILRNKPEPYYFMLSIDARVLKKISDVHRRNPDKERKNDIAIQRTRKDKRVHEIEKYIEGGFPWSTLSKNEQSLPENEGLKMPGLLPTAIIANILIDGDERNGKKLNAADQIKILDKNEKGERFPFPKLIIPEHIFSDKNWNPDLKPLEIIDGQHRLWAFDEDQSLSGNYEFPVVLFNNLDRAWQAYLFYTINIKPVKINTSLGFDLYPLLRTQNWLENSKEGLLAYRETRAQEIVEALWIYEKSPWYQRINMIGETGGPTMSQAAFIRALVNTFFKRSKGLFSDKINENYKLINWNRSQQAGFIILLWQKIANATKNCTNEWATALRSERQQSSLFNSDNELDRAFVSKNSFLSRDQGVRGLLSFANDFFYVAAYYNDIDFNEFLWKGEPDENSIQSESISSAIDIFESNTIFVKLLNEFANSTMDVDWRTSSATFDRDSEREYQMRYKGSSGYSEFSREMTSKFLRSTDPLILKYTTQVAAL